jgi:hypothetical protein
VKIDKKVEATLYHWGKAVSDAKAFFESADFVEQGKKCQDAIRRIRASLNYTAIHIQLRRLAELP